MSTFNFKRTRSQLTLPALDPSALGRSPLKDARSAFRNGINLPDSIPPQRELSKLRIASSSSMDGEEDEDEILLSPDKRANKNKKRYSDEAHGGDENSTDSRAPKRAKVMDLPADTHTAQSKQTSTSGPFDFKRAKSIERTTSSHDLSTSSHTPTRHVPHIDLKTMSPSPWRTGSGLQSRTPIKDRMKPKSKGRLSLDSTSTPSTPPVKGKLPAIVINAKTPEAQTPKAQTTFGMGTGMLGPMSPLTPLPPTPAIFGAGGTLRAFTAKKNEGPNAENRQAEGWGAQKKPTQRAPSRMNVVTTFTDSAPSTPAPADPSTDQAPEPSSSVMANPEPKNASSKATASTSTSTVAPPLKSRGRSASVVSNGAGAWGPKPKTPSVLKVQRPPPGRAAARAGAGRVTRSVSMKEKMGDEPEAADEGDAAPKKSYSFTFKPPTGSTSQGINMAKKASTTSNGKMKQMSMKDFMAGSSTSRPVGASSSTSSTQQPKSRPSSPSKPKPAWNASAGSPSKPAPLPRSKPVSSLSTLSLALEKLAMPRPTRPSTSMGFISTTDAIDTSGVKDDGGVGKKREGMVALGVAAGTSAAGGRGLKRSATVGDRAFSRPLGSSGPVAPTAVSGLSSPAKEKSGPSGASTATRVPPSPTKGSNTNSPPKRPSAMVAHPAGPSIRPPGARPLPERGTKIFGTAGSSGAGIFGAGRSGGIIAGGALGRKASKKTTLPSVMASPVKGAGAHDSMGEDGPSNGDLTEAAEDGDVSMRSTADISVVMNDVNDEVDGDKEKPKNSWKQNASRRASMASQALTQSLSGIPRTPSKGLMGPPRTPKRSASSTYPEVASPSKDKPAEDKRIVREEGAGATKSAPSMLGRVKSGSGGHVGTSRSARIFAQEKADSESAATEADADASTDKVNANGTLTMLKDCIIFVDVRTDGGDDAGGLFVDMLKGMGARILTRVGPSCTHIIYKNGLMSTLTRYRILQDPKPLVVGIGWVVECVEQRARVDEARFSVDLDGMNIAGANKRRRSMLPKLLSAEDISDFTEAQEGESAHVDVSMDGSDADSSMRSLDDEELPPLEKARRRRLLLTGKA